MCRGVRGLPDGRWLLAGRPREGQLYLQFKLPNPHHKPGIAAQCIIVNLIVTPDNLEEQMLGRRSRAKEVDVKLEARRTESVRSRTSVLKRTWRLS